MIFFFLCYGEALDQDLLSADSENQMIVLTCPAVQENVKWDLSISGQNQLKSKSSLPAVFLLLKTLQSTYKMVQHTGTVLQGISL